jgi:hypothetical protein
MPPHRISDCRFPIADFDLKGDFSSKHERFDLSYQPMAYELRATLLLLIVYQVEEFDNLFFRWDAGVHLRGSGGQAVFGHLN